MSSDPLIQRDHEKLLNGLRSDLDHLGINVKDSLESIRVDVKSILEGMSKVGKLEGRIEIFCGKVDETRAQLQLNRKECDTARQDIANKLHSEEIARAKLESSVCAFRDDFEKHRSYQTDWRKEHESGHAKDEASDEERLRRTSDRAWDLLKPLLIGVGGALLLNVAYEYGSRSRSAQFEEAMLRIVKTTQTQQPAPVGP